MRAIDGFSMGGFGAAHLGFKYPDLFGSISLMGAAVHRPEFLRDERPDIFTDAFGGDLAYCAEESPWTLVRENADRLRDRTMMRLFVGEKDSRLREKNVELSDLMNELDLAHEHGVVPNAAHSAAQVIDGMGDAAWTFYRKAFGRE
jgi:endo-1,4-beta-xylanase